MSEARLLATHTPNLPAKLKRIVEKTLRKEKNERYQSGAELLNDLREVKEEIDLEGKIGTSRTRPRERSVKRYKEIAVRRGE